MAVKFAVFSTEQGASLNPWALDPQPSTMIDLEEDPIFGDYDPNAGAKGRGTRIATLGGSVDQDFGTNVKDGRIKLTVRDSFISASTMAAMDTAFAAVDAQYHFTDSRNCWTVKFEKPSGFKYWQNLFYWSSKNAEVFSYEITFKIDSKDI